jgi:hypothetical protein
MNKFLRLITLAGLLSLSLIATPLASPVLASSSDNLGPNCNQFNPSAQWYGVRVSIYVDDPYSGPRADWCPKWDAPSLGYSWDGDPRFCCSDMSWMDIGDSQLPNGGTFNDVASDYEIIVDADYPDVRFCLGWFKNSNYAADPFGDLSLDFVHHEGTKTIIRGNLSPILNDSFSSVKIDYIQLGTFDNCPLGL